MILPTKKKLLVLDVNGLLIERFSLYEKLPNHRPPDGQVGKFCVYRRPYCNEFLAFCFENFEVGIWSSAQQNNVQNLVDFIFGDLKSKLVFSWYQCDCTNTGLKTLENRSKPVFLKELYKLWDKVKPDLPWEKGDYGPFNTLLIDDTPYKAMRNPPHTAIFPYPYEVSKEPDDVLVRTLLKYLEGISAARNVQHYVMFHRFGQPPISEESPHWNFYRKILFIGLPRGNRNYSSVVRTKMSGVTNKTLTSVAYNNDTTQSSSIQESSVPSIERKEKVVTEATKSKKKKRKSAMQAALSQEHEAHNISPVEKEAAFGISQQSELNPVSKEDGLPETGQTCTAERHCAIVTTSSQKHAILNELEEIGAVTSTKPRKKKKKGAKQAALKQDLGAHNISAVDKDSAFGIPQRSDIDMVSRDDGLFEAAVTCTIERNGAIITTSNEQNATVNVLEEKGVAKATKPKKKERECVMQAALNQEHGVHHLSPADEEAAFGIPQPSDLDMVSNDGLFETAVNCTTERNGVTVTTLSQKHASLNGLEENGVAKAIRSKKEKRKSVMEAGAHNIFPMEKEAGLGISQQSDLVMVSKDDGLSEIAVTCMTERNGSSITNLSQKHASPNGLEESGVAKIAKPRKKKIKSVEQHALKQEHGAHNTSPVEKEAAFGLVCMSDVSGKDDDLPGAIVPTLSQKHATLNGLEESGVAKATKPAKKRKGPEQAALNQEPGALNISPVEKEAGFCISQQFDHDPVLEEDGLSETAVTCTAGRHPSIVTPLSQKHATLNELEESGAAKAAKSLKKRRKGAGQAALNQDHGTHNISPVHEAAAFDILQRSDLDTISKDDGVFGTAVTCMAERHGDIISTLSQKHATLDGLEESGAAKAAKPRKKKSKQAKQAASSREHGAHNISPVDKEVAFGIPQQSDLDMVAKDNGLFETEMTCTAERHGVIVTNLSQKHATLNELEESSLAKATKPRKKKKSAKQAASNQEHGAHNISPVEKEAACGISQQADLDLVSKDDSLPKTAVTFMAEKHDAIITTLSQQHATFNKLEESGAAKATKPRKKKKSAELAASSQEHGAHNISLVEKEAAFGISQQADLDPVSKEDGLPETRLTCTAGRHGAIVTTLSQKHAPLNGPEESGAAKPAKPRKKKSKGAEQAALNQEHGTHDISPADKEVAFGIPEQSDLDMVSKGNSLFGTEVTCTAKRHGVIITGMSRKRATFNELEESSLTKATNPRKKKTSAEQAASNQEHGVHNISRVEKEAACGISQRADLDPVSKEDGLPKTAVTFTAERHGASITTLSQQHATLIGLEESGAAKATKPGKKKKSAEQAASNLEHGAYNISPVEKEAAFGISQKADLDPVSKEDGLPKTTLTFTAGRHGAIITTLSQKHATLNGLEESGAAKATKPRKKKKSAEQAASNLEHGAYNISPVEKEAAFGISQQADLDPVSKEDGLPETGLICTAERHGAIVTTLSQQHATLNGLEESGAAEAAKPRKKKKNAEQAASNQEHGAQYISSVEKEPAFGISQQADLYPVSKEDGLPETGLTCTAERHCAIVTTSSQKHAALNGLEESGAAKAAKPRKKKSKGVEQAALSHDHRTHNISPVDKEVAFGIPQQSDLDVVLKDNGLFETEASCTAERHDTIITNLSQKRATPNDLEESSLAKETKHRKKRKNADQAASNQEHGAHNRSPVEKEAAFGISQQADLDTVSKEDGLLETALKFTAERHGATVTILSQKHATLNGLEESGAAKATKPKKKRKSAELTASDQEHGAHNNISPVKTEAAFIISQQSDLHTVSKEDGLLETALKFTAERHGATVTILSQKHATLNGLEESGVAKATKPGKKKRERVGSRLL